MKQKNLLFIVILVCSFIFTNVACTSIDYTKQTKIRIGWQVPWATQGQIVQILKHTDILKKNGLEAEFVGRTYGPELNAAALGGEIDVVLTADQPAAALFSKDKGWIGIGRLMYNRTSTYVPINSSINTIKELKDKTIGIPIGAAAERVTNEALIRNGLDPKKDVKIINIDIRNQGALVVLNKDKIKWDQFDALSGFDPTPAIFESRRYVKVLDVGKVCSLVLMNNDFIKKNPKVAEKMMQSIFDAYDYYRKNVEQANKWFMQESRLNDIDQNACNIAASIEPNIKVEDRAKMRVYFIEEDFEIMQRAADFIETKIGKRVNMKEFVNNIYVKDIK
ncbi:hypothetical protein A2331_04125 [Candidatus Falkowbacteria bacterium RIFOXYB2_FULL_34_18]|uniref:SsuA/THI5-like domain-containing protein n=1 Tax=Candidatus Falkowbacteria bacterium RIFOXYD2_FULL_34_120 TaxID=1798007 RepID=A0A1F5TS74_9BACT|nr:MAG: hypothetical protein A2331_04125 [Candidatus Falkowbacteria bacterium RIFOXYB2_FULL_34_18]OGF29720.1 MAG: hypothetical protein A2500_00400 [Candidatus Falkowbacteria bacterium RIFOXYC12_FULL_34_55]OGF37415.1 MAG: hypothetical protein A2466_00320 [Candidatus Falkowbacteria bacterium RIFOXYC2_FULL_34_220]OGF39140.1 MAG: hypothetical protein A2515_00275 [Candidatus Falkowbacteria bacterium RIFOXYD12_FULL_34_57]OGF41689.1 MAG: hypothetical protein A2531_05995 [Candidatus Falkowbacteria bact